MSVGIGGLHCVDRDHQDGVQLRESISFSEDGVHQMGPVPLIQVLLPIVSYQYIFAGCSLSVGDGFFQYQEF